ncbi:MAG: flavin-dependent monooxygenase [Gammaproteobacteria bacterium]|nr:flavin-dependent monooxygenase [Gammaproteobacteria bacterium]
MQPKLQTVSAIPSPAELLSRADALIPMLRDRAEECERRATVPAETIQAFQDAGFFRILQPARYGGYEYWLPVFYEVVIRLARGCPSSAWVLSVLGIHNWEAGLIDPRVAEALWKDDPDVRFSSSYAPFGKATRVAGGYRLEGRWPWSSGCDHATWVILGADAEMENGELNRVAIVLPREDYEIDESSWNSAGMAGTGSKDIVVRGAFVPAHQLHNIQLSITMEEPGKKAFTADTYQVSFGVGFAYALATVALGIAEAALAEFIPYMRKRTSAYFPGAEFRQDPIVQKALAEAHTVIDGARLKYERDFREMADYIARGETIPVERRVFYKWNTAAVAKAARDAINLLLPSCGGSAFNTKNPMQRYFRDVNCVANHLYLSFDKGAVNFGMHLLTGGNADVLV